MAAKGAQLSVTLFGEYTASLFIPNFFGGWHAVRNIWDMRPTHALRKELRPSDPYTLKWQNAAIGKRAV